MVRSLARRAGKGNTPVGLEPIPPRPLVLASIRNSTLLPAALLLSSVLAGCGSESDASPETAIGAQNPAPATPGAMSPPASATPAPATPPAAAPAATPGNEAPPSNTPLQPDAPSGSGNMGSDDTGPGNTGAAGAGAEPSAPAAPDPAAMEPTAMEPAPEPPAMEPPAAFAPCPTDGTPCVIMPLGDSITFGIGAMTPVAGQGGYRVELFRRALADGHDITFTGRVANGPNTLDGQPFPRGNEGYPGATINDGNNQLANRVDAALAAADPHIILLMVGTNDVFGQAQNPPSDLGNLLDQLTNAEPDALLVVAQIVPIQQAAGNARAQAYNATMPALVQERVAAGKHIMLVDMFTPLANNPGLFADVLHPNDAGYVAMAQTWYTAIEPFLP